MLVAVNEHEAPEFWYLVSAHADENSALVDVPEGVAERWAESILEFMKTQKEIEETMFEQVVSFP